MPDRIVRIILSGDSRGAVRAIEETEAATTRFSDTAKRVGSGLKRFGTNMSFLSAGVAGIGYESVKSAMSYQRAMTMIRAQAGATRQQVAYYNREIMAMNGKYGFDPTQMANGLYNIASGGIKGAQAMSALVSAMKGAQIGGDSLTDTTRAMTGALNLHMKGVNSTAQAMQIMDTAVGQGMMHLEDLTSTFGTRIYSQAAAAGLGFRDVTDAIAAMTRTGVPAQVQATALRLMLTKLAAPTGVGLEQIEALRMGQYELANDLRKPNGLILALTDLQNHLQPLSQDQRVSALSNMFGASRGSATIMSLLRTLPQMRSVMVQLDRAGAKSFGAHWAETQATASFQLHRALAELGTAATRLGQSILPVLLPLMRGVADSVEHMSRWFDHLSPSARHTVVIFGLFATVLGPLVFVLGSMIEAVGAVAGAITFLTGAATAAEIVFAALDIMLGVGIILALVALYAKCKEFRTIVNAVFGYAWQYIKQVFSDLIEVARGFMQFVSGIWDVIKGVWTLNGHEISKGMGNIFHGMVKMVIGEFKYMYQPFLDIFGSISKHWSRILRDMLNAVKWFVKEALKVFGSITGLSGHGLMSYLSPLGALGHLTHGHLFGLHFARGGLVPASGAAGGVGGGAGGDTVPAMLTPGEFVLRPQVVSAIGVQQLNALNQSGSLAAGTQGDIIIPITLKTGERVLAQAVTRYSSQMSARK